MKLRTDFVTNSSSSSFTILTFHTMDGKNLVVDLGERMWTDGGGEMLQLSKGSLKYCRYNEDWELQEKPIKSVQDLAAVLFFNNGVEGLEYKILTPVFSYLIGKLSARKLIAKLEDAEFFEDLQDIDPDDYDDREELREAVLEALVTGMEDLESDADLEDESVLESFREVIRSVGSLAELSHVTASTCETNWGEFINMYSERLASVVEEHPFAAVPAEDPGYAEALRFWNGVMEKEVLMGDVPLEQNAVTKGVEKALASGVVWDMLPDTVQSNRDVVYSITESSGTGGIFVFDEVKELTFDGKVFVLTGFSLAEEENLTAYITGKGGEVKSSTVQKTNYLIIQKDYKKPTKKYEKALELKDKGKTVLVVSSEAFYELFPDAK